MPVIKLEKTSVSLVAKSRQKGNKQLHSSVRPANIHRMSQEENERILASRFMTQSQQKSDEDNDDDEMNKTCNKTKRKLKLTGKFPLYLSELSKALPTNTISNFGSIMSPTNNANIKARKFANQNKKKDSMPRKLLDLIHKDRTSMINSECRKYDLVPMLPTRNVELFKKAIDFVESQKLPQIRLSAVHWKFNKSNKRYSLPLNYYP